MANKKITDLDELNFASASITDVLPIVDIDADATKKITLATLKSGSFSGSFQGDGSGITGVTAEWDGSHNGDASITGSLIVSSSSPTSIQLGDGSVFKVSNPSGSIFINGSGSVTITGSLGITGSSDFGGPVTVSGSITISGSGGVITSNQTGSFATTGSNNFSGNVTVTGSLTVSGSDTFTNIGPFNQTGNSNFTGNITVSEISSSGNISGSTVLVNDKIFFQKAGTYIQGTNSEFGSTLDFYAENQKLGFVTLEGAGNATFSNLDDIFFSSANIKGARSISGSTVEAPSVLTQELKSSTEDISIQNASAEMKNINITASGNIDINSLNGGIRLHNSGETYPIHISASGNAVLKSLNAGVIIEAAGGEGGNITLTPTAIGGNLNLMGGAVSGDINMDAAAGKLASNVANIHLTSSGEYYLRKIGTGEELAKNHQIKGNESGLFVDGMNNSPIYITGSQTIRIQRGGNDEAGNPSTSTIEVDNAGNITIQAPSTQTIKISGSSDIRVTDLPSIQPSVSGGLWLSGSVDNGSGAFKSKLVCIFQP